MAKAYRCADCKFLRATKWTGRCPGCRGFFNIQTTSADVEGNHDRPDPVNDGQVVTLDEVASAPQERISTEIAGLDKILGRDPVEKNFGLAVKAGHAVQIYGEPGAGKSTLITQACRGLAKQRHKVLYVAGEESLEQIKARTNRVGKFSTKFRLVKETDLDVLLEIIDEEEPEIVVIDSVNMVEVDEYDIGSMAAVKIATKEFNRQAKKYAFALIIVVQITKGGDFSGPKSLEHMVDTSLYLRHGPDKTRVLECKEKNRYGDTPVFAHFKMTENGLTEYELPSDDDDDAKQERRARKLKTKAALKSVPLDGTHTPSPSSTIPKGIKHVLAVPCDTCGVPADKACTADDGSREAGFHQSRAAKSKVRLVKKPKKRPPEVTT